MNNNNDRLTKIIKNALIFWFCVLLALCMYMVTGGCTRYIPKETVIERTDTIERTIKVTLRDTLRTTERVTDNRYDSVAPILDSLNRVIGWERWHWRETSASSDREHSRLVTLNDSLRQALSHKEAVREPYPVEVPVEVERKLTWWQTTQIWAGRILLGAFALGIGALLIWMIKKRSN